MALQLLFIKGPDQGRAVDLRRGKKTIIGRDDTCDLVVHDPRVSRKHCNIEVLDNRTVLTDRDSSYGTTLNGRKIDVAEIQPGDVIALGETEMRLIAATDSSAETASPRARAPEKVLDDARTGPGSGLKVVPGSRNLENLVGTTLVRYVVEEQLAHGKSGMVFRANDTKHNRPVALKVLWPELADDEKAVQRFIRAMKTMLPMKHPNIVRLYGAGLTDGYCWMAMELVEGESLAQMLARMGVGGMLDWQAAFRATLHIARALELADEHQIVHRNINPGNILVGKKDRVAKLGDLMLAKALEGTMAESITRAGEIIGELAYLSPEQTSLTGEIDCRSDIYCLGATAYRLVAGRTPFEATNPASMIQKIQKETPPLPTKFQLAIPPHFEGVITKMIARDPQNRYANPSLLVRELEKVAKYQNLGDI